ncbi:MAG: hypothetical protein A2W99_05710 [Bacteroidetes bacterium GWF2_33_16]|nr:MAG: hypothetical protein A2X00_13185 [Bacteroidetes bacterium GWE2_32_14]OFY05183.1 MAG: hypothetical protein A2W99_05710 [Bacteroidetes bacterium GWF2_33_16]
MKRLLFVLTGILLAISLFSQSPDVFKYQASLRDDSGKPLASQTADISISILQGNPSGSVVYVETHNKLTDSFGNINLEIGKGNTASNFSIIDWSLGSYYIKIVVNGNELGVFQLLSVPYAKFADKAGNGFSGNYNDLSNLPDFTNWDINASDDFSGQYSDLFGKPDLSDTSSYIRTSIPQAGDIVFFNGTNWQLLPKGNNNQMLIIENNMPAWRNTTIETTSNYIGKLYEGGIIFYVSPNGQHGLIASLYDLDDGTGAAWSEFVSAEAFATSWYNGSTNTDSIILQGATSSAALLCRSLGDDWYLPSAWELNLLYDNAYEINSILEKDSDPNTKGLLITGSSPEGRYWSSTENGLNRAWSFMINFGNTANSNKLTKCRVRAVKAF